MRSEFENSLGHTDGFHDGYVKWNELSNQYESSDEDYLDVAEWMNGALAIYEKRQTKVDELQKRVDAAFRVLSQLNTLDDEAHKRWKREACMFSQGESNAYEHAVRLLEQALKGGEE